jgi:hypothetical protein
MSRPPRSDPKRLSAEFWDRQGKLHNTTDVLSGINIELQQGDLIAEQRLENGESNLHPTGYWKGENAARVA